ncbi:MAG: rhamnulose-1-phosphate aldolase [Oscillospiraceae bacterium]|jgi:rhamnulose-1-phosphate aldolase|nr:rhamnulose-1-phosphate aldolase [Oscillospiraceae bacterium]
MSMEQCAAVKGFARLCDDGYRMGWHERNGGNLTYRLTAGEATQCRPFFAAVPTGWARLGVAAPNLARELFIATGSGKYMCNVASDIEGNICVVELDDEGAAYRVVWGLSRAGAPTSELPTHILGHSVKKEASDSYRVIYHAHTPSVIALTFVLPLRSEVFTRALWLSMTECPIIFPSGVGVLPWMIPGGADIARETAAIMRAHNVAVWAHHGTFCAGEDFDSTFGLMHILEKSADIYIKALSCGKAPNQTVTDEDLRRLAGAFGVTLNEAYLH